MVGGGQGAFIGAIHRIAARIDGKFDLVAGALSSNPDRAAASAAELGIERSYSSYEEMAVAEAAREDGIQAVAIVTPNHMHAGPAIAFLNAGITVICDKPLAATSEQAAQISEAVEKSDAKFILTHNYTGYPLMRHARQLVADGALGKIRIVQAEYVQDWLSEPADPENKHAAWRTDPSKAGGGAIGDIGTHAFNLLSFVTGLKTQSLLAELHSMVDGRMVDDNAHIMLRLENGARGMVWASQVAVGRENGLALRIYGDKGSIEWAQENPNQMIFSRFGEPRQIITRGGAGLGAGAGDWTRTPPGHPEGYLEGFANIYSDAADLILGAGDGALLPGIQDGLDGMWFISACQQSHAGGNVWIDK
jgi:predicted dehydrogenase